MRDEITINLRALTQEDRKMIYEILRYRGFAIPDETNDEAIETMREFIEK